VNLSYSGFLPWSQAVKLPELSGALFSSSEVLCGFGSCLYILASASIYSFVPSAGSSETVSLNYRFGSTFLIFSLLFLGSAVEQEHESSMVLELGWDFTFC
jgi:hypothetical protein